MAKIELEKKYQNEDFGKPFSDGTYGISHDIQTYELLVDGIPVVNLNVEYERYSSQKPYYACAHISYDNRFFLSKNPNYVNRGYTTMALEAITEMLLKENKVPRITLDINKDNIASLRVAEKAGFKYIKNNEYSIYSPNAIKMIEDGLEYLKDIDLEIYDMQMYSNLSSYRKYLEQCVPKEPVRTR